MTSTDTPTVSSSHPEIQVVLGYDARRATIIWFRDADIENYYDVYTAVVERQGRGIIAASPLIGIHKHELHDLMAVLHDEAAARTDRFVTGVTVEAAGLVLAQAVLQSRVCGRAVPHSVWTHTELLGDMAAFLDEVDDAYSCIACGEGLEGGSQLAIADGSLEGPVLCDSCRGPEMATLRPFTRFVPLWIARAQLMLAAGLPRRAMVVAHYAQEAGASGPALSRIRGWAQLMLGNPAVAERHLGAAVAAVPEEPRTRLMLILARTQSSLAVDATEHVAYLERTPELAADMLEPLRRALDGLSRPGLMQPAAVAEACNRLLVQLEHR